MKDTTEQTGGYHGLQDTGEGSIRSLGSEVQQRDGMGPEDIEDKE